MQIKQYQIVFIQYILHKTEYNVILKNQADGIRYRLFEEDNLICHLYRDIDYNMIYKYALEMNEFYSDIISNFAVSKWVIGKMIYIRLSIIEIKYLSKKLRNFIIKDGKRIIYIEDMYKQNETCN